MSFNVNDFRSKVNKYGVARDNLFVVTINGGKGNADMPEGDLRFFCRSVVIPGLQAQTLEYQNQGHGHNEKRVTNMSFDDLQVIFMVDSGFRVQQYFHRWMQSVVNYDNRDYGREYKDMLPFEVAYKNKVVGKVTIDAYGYHSQKLAYRYEFNNAYPISLGTTDLSWENNDQVLTLPVSFTFSQFIPTKGVGISSPATPRTSSKTLGDGTSPLKVGGTLDTIGGIFDLLGVDNPIQPVVDQFTSVATASNNIENQFGQIENTIGNIFS